MHLTKLGSLVSAATLETGGFSRHASKRFRKSKRSASLQSEDRALHGNDTLQVSITTQDLKLVKESMAVFGGCVLYGNHDETAVTTPMAELPMARTVEVKRILLK